MPAERAINIADLEIDGRDSLGKTICDLYGRKPPEYAVYRTTERVNVYYADTGHGDLGAEQRKALARLNPLRGQINGLIDGWRSKPADTEQRKRAHRYDRRVGDALVVAFEGDVPNAELLLTDIKQDILNERVAIGRIWYLGAALLTAILLVAALLVSNYGASPDSKATAIRHAAAAGAFGSFFSIALAMRRRTVLPDLQLLPNLTDAMLRVTIGVIAAAVLLGMMLSNLVTIQIGAVSVKDLDAVAVVFVGFLAGFSERLVPDLLEKAVATEPTVPVRFIPPPPPPPPADDASDKNGATKAKAAAGDDKPLPPEEANDDSCAATHDLPDDLVASDVELPPAAGGVEKPAQN